MQENEQSASIVVSKKSGQATGHRSSAPGSGAIKIHIASPCYRDTYSSAFVVSLINLLTAWRHSGVGYRFSYMDMADVALTRNLLITRFYYEKTDCSHILFVDNDMGFEPSLINRMIELNESVVGVIAPKRETDLKKLHKQADYPFEKAFARATLFLGKPAKNPQHKPGFMQVDACGAGILLISRDCVTRMIEACPEIVDRNICNYLAAVSEYKTFLTPFKRIETGDEWYSEDISFCRRWVHQCGGRIYANTDSRINHTGYRTVETRYEDLS